jgi:hypothetical protein
MANGAPGCEASSRWFSHDERKRWRSEKGMREPLPYRHGSQAMNAGVVTMMIPEHEGLNRPFRAHVCGTFHNPGRCPGLYYDAPSGRSELPTAGSPRQGCLCCTLSFASQLSRDCSELFLTECDGHRPTLQGRASAPDRDACAAHCLLLRSFRSFRGIAASFS